MKTIKVSSGSSAFAEDKDEAKKIRVDQILPTLEKGESIALDFKSIRYATQSFVHALIGEALKQYGEVVLEQIEFRNCSTQVKDIIHLVADYSLGGFADPESE